MKTLKTAAILVTAVLVILGITYFSAANTAPAKQNVTVAPDHYVYMNGYGPAKCNRCTICVPVVKISGKMYPVTKVGSNTQIFIDVDGKTIVESVSATTKTKVVDKDGKPTDKKVASTLYVDSSHRSPQKDYIDIGYGDKPAINGKPAIQEALLTLSDPYMDQGNYCIKLKGEPRSKAHISVLVNDYDTDRESPSPEFSKTVTLSKNGRYAILLSIDSKTKMTSSVEFAAIAGGSK
jgi:hypothetical protein